MSDSRHAVCAVEELPEGERIIKEVRNREIAVFNVGGDYVAAANYCVHAGGPVCEGTVSGMVTADPDEWEWGWDREGEILACPWHGWEFDLMSGEHLSDPKYRLITYATEVEDGTVYVDLAESGVSPESGPGAETSPQ